MQILIPTYGRKAKQTTWDNLPPSVRERTKFVVQGKEWDEYWCRTQYPVVVLPEWITTVGPTRQWIIDNFMGKVLLLDDDLVFATRRQEDLGKFKPSTPEDIEEMVDTIEVTLDSIPVVGVCAREGGNRQTEYWSDNTRITRVTGLDTRILSHNDVRYDRTPVMEDFDMLLQMLKLGYPNVSLNNWVHNQGGSNTKGGCSTYRTPEIQTEAANKLHELHEPFVKVVKKTTKTAWGGGERTDVNVQWKRAFKFGQANLLDQRAILGKAQ